MIKKIQYTELVQTQGDTVRYKLVQLTLKKKTKKLTLPQKL